MDVIHTYSDDPLDGYPGWDYTKEANTTKVAIQKRRDNNGFERVVLTTDENQKAPDDYLITVVATPKQFGGISYDNLYQTPQYESAEKEAKQEKTTTVHGMLYGHEKAGSGSNVYEIQPNQYIYHCLKRAPKIVFDRNPQSVIPTDFEINPGNRFKPKGVMVDNTLDSHPTDSLIYNGNNHFSYFIFVPDELAWTESDGENPKDANGNPVVKVEICDDGYGNPAGASNTDASSEFYWGNEAHQYVYDLDEDGNVIKNADGTPKGEIKTGKRYFTKLNWNNDDLRIKFHGTGRFPMTYTIVPWNPQWWDLGSSQTFLFNIEKSVPTHFVISPDTIVTANGKVSAAPKVRVVDDAGNDVTKYFDITPAKANQSDGYNLGLGNNGIAKYAISPWAASADGYKINVSAKLNDEGKQQHYGIPDEGTYTIIVKDATSGNVAQYDIFYDAKLYDTPTGLSSAASDMGKFHFVKDGDFYPGSIVQDEIPGVDIQIGTPTETGKGVVYNVSNNTLLLNNTVVPDGTDLPVTGYIRVMPLTNGFLSIDVLFHPGDLWILRDMNTLEEQQLTTDKDEEYAQKQFALPLLAGHTYALWSDRMSGFVRGLNFDPQFISLKTDHEGWHDATTFQNGYTGTLPKLAEREKPTVSYYLRDVASKTSTSVEKLATAVSKGFTAGYHAHVNTTTGQVNAIELTADNTLTPTTGAEMENRVTIVGSVLGKKKADGTQVEKRPHYNLFIGAMPTYVVEEGDNFDMGNRISTNNIPTRIWMTFGGWVHMNDANYPYRKSRNNLELNDGWKTAKLDSVGRDEMTIDGFKYSSFGEENPVDENIQAWNSFRSAKPWNHDGAKTGKLETLDGQRDGFMVPVRGTYLKFEPEESGKLFLYVLQNGMTEIAKGDATGKWDNSDAKYLRRRALYIIDETGNNVEIADGNEGWSESLDEYLPSDRKTISSRFNGYTIPNRNFYCEGILRAGWADGSNHAESSEDGYKAFEIDQSADGKYSWRNSYDHTADGLTAKGQENLNADVKLITDWWKNNADSYAAYGARTSQWTGHGKLGGPDEVLRLSDGGFVLPTKGYVRYTFNVRAGKTYYVFMTGSKLGFCGFGFLPAGYTQHSVKWINATDGIDNPELSNKAGFKKAVYDKLPKPTETEVFHVNNISNEEGTNEIGTGGSSSTITGNIGGTAITLDANLKSAAAGSYKGQLAKIFTTRDSVHQFVDVNLKRKFMKRHWSGICLPFSVSENQVKRVFGDHTSVITLDSVRFGEGPDSKAYRTLHFTRHVIQNIEAGRPYYIYPDGDAVSDTTGTGDNVVFTYKDGDKTVNGLQFHAVTFENVKPMDLICYNEDAYNRGSDIFTYRVAGLYDCGDIPFYSYYMRLGANDKSKNNLSRVVPANESVTALPQLTGYNTYLYPHSSDVKGKDVLNLTNTTTTTNAKAASFWITGGEVDGGEVTGIKELIDEVNTEATTFVKGVYTVDGRKVRNDNSLNGLPAGVYIMNGKKYNVK